MTSNTEVYFLPIATSNYITNYFSQNYEFLERVLENMMIRFLERTLNRYKTRVPRQINFKNTQIALSTSIPSAPIMYNDRIELQFGGTIFSSDKPYTAKPLMSSHLPLYNETDTSDLQIFISQQLLQSYIEFAKEQDYNIELSNTVASSLPIPSEVFTVGYFSYLFPFLKEQYPENTTIKLSAWFHQNSNTSVEFLKGRIKAKLSPALKVFAGEELAFTLSVTIDISANIGFEVGEHKSRIIGNNPDVSFSDITFTNNKLEGREDTATNILLSLQYLVKPLFRNYAKNFLTKGFVIKPIPIKQLNLLIERPTVEFNDGYVQLSSNVITNIEFKDKE